METNEKVMTPEELAQLNGGYRYEVYVDKDGNVTVVIVGEN